MQFKLHFDYEVNCDLYEDYCKFIFDEVCSAVDNLVDPRKYRVRESYILTTPLMKWVQVPKRINLVYYITHCLEMVKVKSEYVIRVNPRIKLPYALTKVEFLIRLLEYGNEKLPALPVIRRVMMYYSQNYQTMLDKFLERRMTE